MPQERQGAVRGAEDLIELPPPSNWSVEDAHVLIRRLGLVGAAELIGSADDEAVEEYAVELQASRSAQVRHLGRLVSLRSSCPWVPTHP